MWSIEKAWTTRICKPNGKLHDFLEIMQNSILAVPSSDCSLKCSSLNVEQTWAVVPAILCNWERLHYWSQKNLKNIFLHSWLASDGFAPVLTETTVMVLSFVKLLLQISCKHLVMSCRCPTNQKAFALLESVCQIRKK